MQPATNVYALCDYASEGDQYSVKRGTPHFLRYEVDDMDTDSATGSAPQCFPPHSLTIFSLFVCVSLPRVFTLIQTDKSPARLFYLFCQEFETCSHNDGWPFNGFTFFVRRSIWYLGWLHYFCTLLFSIPLPLFCFTFFLSKNYLTTWWDESLLKLKTCSVSTCLVSLQG